MTDPKPEPDDAVEAQLYREMLAHAIPGPTDEERRQDFARFQDLLGSMAEEEPDSPPVPVSGPARVRVLVVDDHSMWREAIARDLVEAGFDVVATAGDAREAVQRAQALQPALVVLDLNLPDQPGVEVCRQLMDITPAPRVLVVSASGEHADVLEAVKLGATGYLIKSASRDELLDVVRRIARGDAVFTAGLAGLTLGEFRRLAAESAPGAPRPTEREIEVLRLVASGLPAAAIADQLMLTPGTMEAHLNRALARLRRRNRVDSYAISPGPDDLED